MKWVQAADGGSLYVDDRGHLLGTLKPVSDDPRVKWFASVMQRGYLRPHGGWLDERAAKGTVEHFAQAGWVSPHPEECSCQGCTTLRYERRINHVTQADEDELAKILSQEKTA